MRALSIYVLLAGAGLQATTLERLDLDEMIRKSTEIVRGRVSATGSVRRGSLIFTQATVSVTERLKGAGPPSVQVNIPGGIHGNERLTVSGAPRLREGYEYVLFLWTGKSGVTQVLGFSQGVFDLKAAEDGTAKTDGVAYRAAIAETMLDSRTGQEVADRAVSFSLSDLRARIARVRAQTE